MIGNSIKSDIEPVVAIGGRAVHIPHHITWQYETQIDGSVSYEFFRLEKIEEVLSYL
jgi:putative hydrolase of the HAD superfamily